MASFNKVILCGNVARDPKINEFGTGNKKASFTICYSERGYKKKDGTEVKPVSVFIDCETWGAQANLVQSYVKKGSGLLVEGKLMVDSYDDKNNPGKKVYRTYVKVENMTFTGNAQNSSNNTVSNSSGGHAGAANSQPPAGAGVTASVGRGNTDEGDLPF